MLIARGNRPVVVTNDIFTEEDARHVRSTLAGVLAPERVVGVETGSCPHTAVRDDPSMNLEAVATLTSRFPDADVVLVESGGDNLTLTFSGALADYFIFVIDVAEGDKIPRKRGPGVTNSDLLVINKIDLAPYVRADLAVMDRDARRRARRATLRPDELLHRPRDRRGHRSDRAGHRSVRCPADRVMTHDSRAAARHGRGHRPQICPRKCSPSTPRCSRGLDVGAAGKVGLLNSGLSPLTA